MSNLKTFIPRILNLVYFGQDSAIFESALFKKCYSADVPDAGTRATDLLYLRAVAEKSEEQ